MTTYGVMQDRIADELARTDLTSQIQKSIQSAIRHYERQTFYFNEKTSTLSTSVGAEYYATSDFAFLDKMSEIHSVTVTVNSNIYTLTERTFAYMDDINSSTSFQGQPYDFAYFGQKLRLSPIPDTAYNILVAYTEKTTTLSATTDTNYWMTEAEELIRCRATRKLYEQVIKDQANAGIWLADELEALQALRSETESRQMTGRAVPTYF